MAPPIGVRARGRPRLLYEEVVERFRDMFDHSHELVVHGEWDHALCHKVANGRRGVAETERKRHRGAPYVSFRRDVSLSRRSCHAVAIGHGKAMLLLPRLPWSMGDVELTPKPLMVKAVGGKRLDGGVRP